MLFMHALAQLNLTLLGLFDLTNIQVVMVETDNCCNELFVGSIVRVTGLKLGDGKGSWMAIYLVSTYGKQYLLTPKITLGQLLLFQLFI